MMKEIKNRNINKQISGWHKGKCVYWKRTAALFMSLLMFFSSDSGIAGLATVQAAEKQQTARVITAFLPLSEEIAEQSVSFGTPLEELQLPDTLEAVYTYEQSEENAPEEGSEAKEPKQEEPDETVDDKADEAEDSDKEDNVDSDNMIEDGSAETNDNANDETDNDSAGTDGNTGDNSNSGSIGTDGNMDNNSNEGSTETGNSAEIGKGNGSVETNDNTDGVTEEHSTISGDITNEILDTTESNKEQSGLSKMANRIGNAVATVKEMIVAAVMTGERKLMSLGMFKNRADAEIDSTYTNATDKTLIDITNKTLIDATDKTRMDIADIYDSGQSGMGKESKTENNTETESGVQFELEELTETVIVEMVTWSSTPEYDSMTEGNYIFTPVLPGKIMLEEGIALPEIIVVVEPDLQGEEFEEIDDIKAVERMNSSSFNTPYAVAGTKADTSSGECGVNGDNVTYALTDSNGDDKYDTLTISGTGAMADYSDSLAPWDDYTADITKIIIENGVSSVGGYAFYQCSALDEIRIPNSIESIGESAFSGCSSLVLLEIPNSLKSVAYRAFSGCSNMVVYYSSKDVAPQVQNTLSAITSTKAIVKYEIENSQVHLEITGVGKGTTEIDFPANVGGYPIASANWKARPSIVIKHTRSEHNILNGECAICGYQKAPDIQIDFVEELLIGFAEGKNYLIDDKEYALADAASNTPRSIAIEDAWFGKTVSIIAKGSGTGQSDSEEQELEIPARPDAPAKLSATGVSYNAADGMLSGVDIGMEYKKVNADKWETVPGNPITGLAAGEYEVRVAAVPEKSFASLPTKITVEEYIAKKEDTPNAKIDYLQESFIELIPNAIYRIEGTEVAADKNGFVTIPDNWMDDKQHPIIKVENPPITEASDAQMLKIPKRPDAPKGINVKHETEEGKGGALTGLKTTMEYRKQDDADWSEIKKDQSTITGLEPGIYEIRLKSTNKMFASQIVKKNIAAVNMMPEPIPKLRIDYLSDSLTDAVKGADYQIEGELFTADSKNIEIKEEWFNSTIYIVRAGNGFTTTDSDVQELSIPPRPPAPTDVDYVPETDTNKKDGKLTGVNDEMEYRKGDGEWEKIKGATVPGLVPGIYEVRFKATKNTFSSESVTVYLTGNERVPEPKPDAGIEYYDECFIYLEPNSSYLINGENKQTDDNGSIHLKSGWIGKEVSIIKKGDNVITKNSEAQEITVPKRPPAPKGIKAVAESAENAGNGMLTGVDNTMVYRKSGSKEWLSMEEKINEIEEDLNAIKLEPGEYEVRYAATYDDFASRSVKKKILAYGEEDKPSGDNSDSSTEEDSADDSENAENMQFSEPKKEDETQPQQPEEPDKQETPGAKLQPKKTKSDISDNGDMEEEEESIQWELALEGNRTIDLPEGDNVITVPAKIENGRIVSQTTGRAQAGATESGNQIVVLLVEQGAVIVTVNNIEEDLCSARVADAVAVANAVLSGQEAAQAAKGEIAEIRIDVKQIDTSVSQADKRLVEQGMESYQKEFPDLQMGMYIDISVFVRTGEDKWNTIEVTSELIEIIINIPDTLKTLSADFYTMRTHGGEYHLLEDMDDVKETITIQTHLFSTYAVIYQLIDAAENAGNSTAVMRMMQWLSNYGLILLIFLLVEIIIILLLMLYLQHKKKGEKAEKEILT